MIADIHPLRAGHVEDVYRTRQGDGIYAVADKRLELVFNENLPVGGQEVGVRRDIAPIRGEADQLTNTVVGEVRPLRDVLLRQGVQLRPEGRACASGVRELFDVLEPPLSLA